MECTCDRDGPSRVRAYPDVVFGSTGPRPEPGRCGQRAASPTATVFRGSTSYNDLEDLPTIGGEEIRGDATGLVGTAVALVITEASDADIDGMFS